MSGNSIGVVILFSSQDARFMQYCVQQAALFSEQIWCVFSTHLCDGTPDNPVILEEVIEKLHNTTPAHFVCCPMRNKEALAAHVFPLCGYRVEALNVLKGKTDWVLFLDADEIVEGAAFKSFWDSGVLQRQFNGASFRNYWYFRSCRYRATTTEYSPVIAKTAMVTPEHLLHKNDRWGLLRLPGCVQDVFSLERKPMFHHYSWVRTKEEMIAKVQTWGHKDDRSNWVQLVEEEFSRPFNGTDFVHHYKYDILDTPVFDCGL